jgi:phage gp46-like protein
MPDFRLYPVSTLDSVTFDWLSNAAGQIDETQALASAVLIALNTDALADVSDVLPDPRDSDRRGWWGDLDAAKLRRGWPIGSKLWLLRRAKIVGSDASEGSTLVRVESYCRACLQPFVDARMFSQFTVVAQQETDQRITASIVIYRGPKPAIQLQYAVLWVEIENLPLPPPTQATGIMPP